MSEIEKLEERIESLEYVLATFIAWSDTTLGRDNVLKLLKKMSDLETGTPIENMKMGSEE